MLFAASAALLAPGAGIAQSKVRRIAVVGMTPPAAAKGILDSLRAGLREAGYVEGQNLAIEYRYGSFESDRLPVTELLAQKPDVLVAWATPPSLAARDATSTTPIVFAGVADPVASGLVQSLARPGGNITGVTNFSADLVVKQLQLLRDLFPGVERIGVVGNPKNQGVKLQLDQAERSIRELGLRHRFREARTPQGFASAFERFRANGISAAVMLPDPSLVEHAAVIANAAIKSRIATMFQRRENADAGGLISYGPDLTDQFRQAAGYVDRILKGAKPADMPVQQPTKLTLVINAKTANALGVTIPQSVLLRADKVID